MSFYKIRPKSGTATQWQTANPVLGEREIGFEYPEGGLGTGVVKLKMGDGVTHWNDLEYAIPVVLTPDNIVTEPSAEDDKAISASFAKKLMDGMKFNRVEMGTGSAENVDFDSDGLARYPVSFNTPFKTAPIVITNVQSTWLNLGKQTSATEITENGFKLICYSYDKSAFSYQWIAFGFDSANTLDIPRD